MSWRPEGWIPKISFEEITHLKPSLVSMMTEKECKIYEAGADAMLEALKKDGVHFKKGEWTDDATFEVDNPGTVVFIPDS